MEMISKDWKFKVRDWDRVLIWEAGKICRSGKNKYVLYEIVFDFFI